MTLWVVIGVVAALNLAIKGAGPAVLGARELPVPARRVIALLAPALLAALVVCDLLGEDWSHVDGVQVAGVAAAATGRMLRAPLLVALVVGAVTAALLRLAV